MRRFNLLTLSTDSFRCIPRANFTQAIIDAVRNAKKGTTVGEVIAARKNPLPPADQEEAPRNLSGVNQYTKDNSSVDNINRPKGGTDTTYTLRRLARDNPSPRHGEIGNGRKGESRGNNVTSTVRGNDTTYTLRRLARDNPELLDKIEAGELSVNQAAIQAGIRKKPQPSEKRLRRRWQS